jgi:alpha-tubulin suppressor-like RCC1 family protein
MLSRRWAAIPAGVAIVLLAAAAFAVATGQDRAPKATAANVAVVSPGGDHTCAVTGGGSVQCWGDNGYNQLGTGNSTDSWVPTAVSGLGNGSATSVATGGYHTCALTTGGGVKCWGYGQYGQVGNGTFDAYVSTPTDVSGLTSGVTAIAVGYYHSCAVTGGGVKCWGQNGSGKLGNGGGPDQNAPVDVTGLSSGVVAIAGGGAFTCALLDDGAVKCWGANTSGQLGSGTPGNSLTPVDVSGLSNAVAIAAGFGHACALTDGGGMKCWGANSDGQLGTDGTDNAPTPVDVSGLTSGVVGIGATNGGASCAVLASGAAKCWGNSPNGQVGDGTTDDRHAPTDVSGLTSGVTAIAPGPQHTCAIVNNGIMCWGYGANGKLGTGNEQTSHVPVEVVDLGPKSPPPPPPPTPTNTPEGSTPAATNTPRAATPTRTATQPAPTVVGDADKDGTVTSLDALHVLQFTAGLTNAPNPRADANEDGVFNSIDAALILQYVGGLLSHLPL